MRVKALYLIDLPSLKLGLCENLFHQLMKLDEGEGTLYLIDLPSLKLGLCENLLHQLIQLDECEDNVPDKPLWPLAWSLRESSPPADAA
jgi:hypothetical protein